MNAEVSNNSNSEAKNSKEPKDEDMNETDDSSSGEESESDQHIEPITDGREISFNARTLNQFLVCTICNGYYRNAHTVNTCLHSFCYECIIDHFYRPHNRVCCPICRDPIPANPLKNVVRADPVLQNIVDKVFPRSESVEETEESKSATQSSHDAALKMERNPKREIVFEFRHEPREKSSTSPDQPSHPFIRTQYSVCVKTLKKYLLLKRPSLGSIDNIEITCKNDPLGDEWNLEFIRKTRWQDHTRDMVLCFRERKRK
eukprot:609825_1